MLSVFIKTWHRCIDFDQTSHAVSLENSTDGLDRAKSLLFAHTCKTVYTYRVSVKLSLNVELGM